MYRIFIACANVVVLIAMCMDYRIVRSLAYSLFLGMVVFCLWVVTDNRIVIGQVVQAEPIDLDRGVTVASVSNPLPRIVSSDENVVELIHRSKAIVVDPLGDLEMVVDGTLWLVGYGVPTQINDKLYVDLPAHYVATIPTLRLPINSRRVQQWLSENRLLLIVGALALLFAGGALLHVYSAFLFGTAAAVAVWHLVILLAQMGALPMQGLAFSLIAFCVGVAFATMCFRLKRGVMAWTMYRLGAVILLLMAQPFFDMVYPTIDPVWMTVAIAVVMLYPPLAIALLSTTLGLAGVDDASQLYSLSLFAVSMVVVLVLSFTTRPRGGRDDSSPDQVIT